MSSFIPCFPEEVLSLLDTRASSLKQRQNPYMLGGQGLKWDDCVCCPNALPTPGPWALLLGGLR